MTAQEVYATLSDTAKAQHQAAWTRVSGKVSHLAAKPIGGRKPKVFEVHHAVEHARGLYFTELARGLPSDLCERVVCKAYGLTD